MFWEEKNMERCTSQLTVCFQSPFWVGVAERWDSGGYQVCRVVFGAEPTDPEVYQWLEREWCHLEFTPLQPAAPPRHAANPKRVQRQTRKALKTGPGTKAQQALAQQRQERVEQCQCRRRAERQEQQEHRFQLRQQKKREKRRGH